MPKGKPNKRYTPEFKISTAREITLPFVSFTAFQQADGAASASVTTPFLSAAGKRKGQR